MPMKHNFSKKRCSTNRPFSEINIWPWEKLPALVLCSEWNVALLTTPGSTLTRECCTSTVPRCSFLLPHVQHIYSLVNCPTQAPAGQKMLAVSIFPNIIFFKALGSSSTKDQRGIWYVKQKAIPVSKYLCVPCSYYFSIIMSNNSNC